MSSSADTPATNQWATQLEAARSYLIEHDPVLAAVIINAPLPSFKPHTNYYQELVESIISQQLSVKAAATILQRFIDLFTGGFPDPKQLLATNIEHLRGAGLSRQKAGYLYDLAQKVSEGTVQFDQLDALPNETIIEELTKIKGVGVWTVHMFLLFCMGRLNVLPTGDLGIRNGIQKLYKLPERPTEQEVITIAQKYTWHPYESVASWYVWHSLDNKPML